MTTNTVGSVARQDPRQVSNTLKYTLNFGDAGASTGILIGTLPMGAFITMVLFEVVTAFNAGTTNPITVGSVSTAYNNIMASGDNTPGTPGVYQPTVAATKYGRAAAAAADTPIYIKYAPTGTAATTGQGVFLLEFEGGWTT